MAIEIERKFLVKNLDWQAEAIKTYYKQGYVCNEKDKVVRVRIAGEQAFLTIKGKAQGISRLEFEYTIPLADAHTLLNELCEKPLIEKYRYLLDYQGFTWEIDEFLGDNAGLIVAEIELRSESEAFSRPQWLGEEVTTDTRYLNANLIHNPYKNWEKK
ncbi:MAG: CYTH domain-containing protein [Microscillaceae bacterium]|jgi:adenylate cyclase|nr:CYTH domain-containing protein [Microscillaceae bacterium]